MLLGLLGRKGVGKDLLADYLVQQYKYEKGSIAAPLKEGCRILFGFSHDQVHGQGRDQLDHRYGLTPRAILQRVGTDFIRKEFREDFWIDRLLINPQLSRLVISDVRFPNEVRKIQERGGKVIRLSCSLAPKDTHQSNEHQSEAGVDLIREYDGHIVNDGSVNELYRRMDCLMERLRDE